MTRSIVRSALTALIAGLLLPASSHAQESESDLCFSGRPLPECSAFMLTEFGYARRLNDSQRAGSSGRWLLGGELGLMVNRGERSALGGAFFLGAEDAGTRWGFRPRYRRWLEDGLVLDVAPGILFAGQLGQFEPKFPGFSGQVALGYRDIAAVTTQFEIIPSDQQGTRTEAFIGARGGAAVGVIGGLATAALVVIAVATAF